MQESNNGKAFKILKILKLTTRLLKWLIVDTFPISIFPFFVFIHLCVIFFFGSYSSIINSYASGFFQIIGGIVILMIINENVGVISKSNIYGLFLKWINNCPLVLKSKQYSIKIDSIAQVQGIESQRIMPEFSNVEEKVDFLMKEIEKIYHFIKEIDQKFSSELKVVSQNFQDKFRLTECEISKMDDKIKKTILGSVKWQFFGVFLVIYGIVISFL